MNNTKRRRNRQSWPGDCGYCHRSVIWHYEWEGQSRPAPLNDMELGGGKHSCSTYFHYRRMMKHLKSTTIDLRPTEAKEIFRVISKDSIADWQKDILRNEVQRIATGQTSRTRQSNRINTRLSPKQEYDPKVIRIGSSVLLREVDGHERTFLLVGWNDKKTLLLPGAISSDSPLSKALLGHRPGDEVTVNAPSRQIVYEIRTVEQTLPRPHDIDDAEEAA